MPQKICSIIFLLEKEDTILTWKGYQNNIFKAFIPALILYIFGDLLEYYVKHTYYRDES